MRIWDSRFMWLGLYLVAAIVVAVTGWLVSYHFQSDDPPGDISRAFWSAVAGALWPAVLVGTAQLLAVRYFVRRLRGANAEDPEPAPSVAIREVSMRP
jgi:hypothetical protein